MHVFSLHVYFSYSQRGKERLSSTRMLPVARVITETGIEGQSFALILFTLYNGFKKEKNDVIKDNFNFFCCFYSHYFSIFCNKQIPLK